MNAERLHAIANAIYDEMSSADTVGKVGGLRDNLRQSLNAPNQPGPQQQISQLRAELDERLAQAPSNGFSPAWREALDELGIADLLGEELRQTIDQIFEGNQLTPATAADQLDPIVERVQALVAALENIRNGFEFLNIGAEELEPGEVEIGFLIPRRAVKEDLELLGKEFIKLQQILGPFIEIKTGSREAVRVRTISSSGFAAFLESTPAVALIVGFAVRHLIAEYKNVLEIRLLRQQLKEAGASDKSLKSLANDAESSMGKAVGGLVDEMMKEVKGFDAGRTNELRQELKVSLNAIANRIDAGYSVEVRVGELPPPPTGEGGEPESESKEEKEKRAIVEQVQTMQESLRFTNPTGEPILSLPETTPTSSIAGRSRASSGASGSGESGQGTGKSKPRQPTE